MSAILFVNCLLLTSIVFAQARSMDNDVKLVREMTTLASQILLLPEPDNDEPTFDICGTYSASYQHGRLRVP